MKKTELPHYLKDYFTADIYIKLLKKKAFHPFAHKDATLVRIIHDAGKETMRGAVARAGGLIRAFPQIKRVLHLERGIRVHFKNGAFYAEEKVDGYNVRVAMVEGEPVAFTRGGFVCPFTMDRLSELVNLGFFKSHPDFILCGEVAGPENPYNTEPIPYVEEDVKFFAFDVMDGEGRFLPHGEKYRLLSDFGIGQVRHWGPFEAVDIGRLREIVLELNRGHREGLVLKPAGGGEPMKYVTPGSSFADIKATAPLLAELPAGYYAQRLFRVIFFSHEFGLPVEDGDLLDCARTLYGENLKLLKTVEEGGGITESFRIRVNRPETADELIHHLKTSHEIEARLVALEKKEGYWEARFRKLYRKGTRELRRKLKGHGFYD
jgi:putative ATP-dependent DNA ligase